MVGSRQRQRRLRERQIELVSSSSVLLNAEGQGFRQCFVRRWGDRFRHNTVNSDEAMAIGFMCVWLAATLTLFWTVWSVDGLAAGPVSVPSVSSSAVNSGGPVLAVKKDARCEEITIPMCRGIGYNSTSMPNSLHHGKYINNMFFSNFVCLIKLAMFTK